MKNIKQKHAHFQDWTTTPTSLQAAIRALIKIPISPSSGGEKTDDFRAKLPFYPRRFALTSPYVIMSQTVSVISGYMWKRWNLLSLKLCVPRPKYDVGFLFVLNSGKTVTQTQRQSVITA